MEDELNRIDDELDIQPPHEPRDQWFLREVIDEAMKDTPDDLSVG